MEEVSFNEFKKIDLRTAKVLSVEDVEGKDKLYKVTVDLGTEKRVLVAGLKPWYKKEELNGKTIVVVANLAPKKLAGIESHGMLLAAGEESGTISLLVLDKDQPAGTIVQ